MMPADRIEKHIVLRALRLRAWQALTDATQFAAWFGVEVEGEFSPGAQVWAVSSHRGYEGRCEMHILEMVTGRRAPAHDLNDEGRGAQLAAIERYVG